jgi:hypothetical protein
MSTPNLDIDFLKWEAAQQTKNMKLPYGAGEKLHEIMINDQIKPEEFLTEFNKILASTETFRWKTFIYLIHLKDRFFDHLASINWILILVFISIFYLFTFLNSKYQLSKRVKKRLKLKSLNKKIYSFCLNIVERFAALSGYYMPTVVIFSTYIRTLLPSYPYLNLLVPDFMRVGILCYGVYPRYMNFGYFFAIIFLFLRFKLPIPRFIKFHFIRGLMIMAMQGVPDIVVQLLQISGAINPGQRVKTTLCLFVINLFWLIPCLYQAITHRYPRSHFIRDAVEIILGRENNEDFKWWDR